MLFCFLTFSSSYYGQKTKEPSITIQSVSALSDDQIKAIHAVNWDRYRFRFEQRVLHFENGFDVVLHSANQLNQMGIACNANEITLTDSASLKSKTVFYLDENNHILEKYVAAPIPKKHVK